MTSTQYSDSQSTIRRFPLVRQAENLRFVRRFPLVRQAETLRFVRRFPLVRQAENLRFVRRFPLVRQAETLRFECRGDAMHRPAHPLVARLFRNEIPAAFKCLEAALPIMALRSAE
jgi:hypothetical protein